MVIKRLRLGQVGTNCYVFGDEQEGVCAVVDPGDQAELVDRQIKETGLKLKYIFLTHGHFDHVLAVPDLHQLYPDVPIYIHKDEVDWDGKGAFMKMAPIPGLNHYDEGDEFTLGKLKIHVMKTPGHSPGSVVLEVGDVLFCGDTLFEGSCGRTDFPGGSYSQILKSLKRLAMLPGNYQVCPGHEGVTTLEEERRSNYYVRQALES